MKTATSVITVRTITLDLAKRAVKCYNEGGDGGCFVDPGGMDLDKRAREKFADGLGSTLFDIRRQVEFIGKRVPEGYGGVAGCPGALILTKDIASDIFANREQYVTAYSVSPLSESIPSRSTIEVLYAPFSNKPFNRANEWLVWGTKFWHWLNPLTFPIEDSRVNDFFGINRPNSVEKYLDFLKAFREFTLSHQEWLPQMWKIDGGDAESENKLWDKMFYGLADLK